MTYEAAFWKKFTHPKMLHGKLEHVHDSFFLRLWVLEQFFCRKQPYHHSCAVAMSAGMNFLYIICIYNNATASWKTLKNYENRLLDSSSETSKHIVAQNKLKGIIIV
jgi:hypothetical protein